MTISIQLPQKLFGAVLAFVMSASPGVAKSFNTSAAQPALERLRQEFPFLDKATEACVLGDVCSRSGLDTRNRQLAAVIAFAAIGETVYMKIYTGYALKSEVSKVELKKMICMVNVPVGEPRVIAASRTLSELFTERRTALPGRQ
jgi:4-carboxymuconolactone decarboxylase